MLRIKEFSDIIPLPGAGVNFAGGSLHGDFCAFPCIALARWGVRVYHYAMDTEIRKKHRIAALYRICPAAHIVGLVSAALICLHLLTRGNKALMIWLSYKVVQPIHRALAQLNSRIPFSVAETLIGAAIAFVMLCITLLVVRLIRGKGRRAVYRFFAVPISAGLAVYAGFCMLWGVYYYGDDFITKSGLSNEPVSVEQLEQTTRYFAELANYYSGMVERDETGAYVCDREKIFVESPEVFSSIEKKFPCLEGPDIAAKGIRFSRIMSYTDFTGFFFPFTAEANVNTDFPPSLFASTVAHELSHQRGVAKEQEANFVAVLACLDYGDADYCYSACLLAYVHLGNSLFTVNRDAWEEIYRSLDVGVLRDFQVNDEYWDQFETPIQTVSNAVYDGFLVSYGQTLGIRSYGACVDLLVNYFCDIQN